MFLQTLKRLNLEYALLQRKFLYGRRWLETGTLSIKVTSWTAKEWRMGTDPSFSKPSWRTYHLHKIKRRLVMNLPSILLPAWNKFKNNRNASFFFSSFFLFFLCVIKTCLISLCLIDSDPWPTQHDIMSRYQNAFPHRYFQRLH